MSFDLIFLYIFGEEIRATENFLRDGTVGQELSMTDTMFLPFCVLRIFISLATVLSLKGIIQVVARVDGLV